MAYSDKVIDHYNNPRNVGALPKEDPNVGTGLVGAPECGDVMKLQIKVNEETERHRRREVQDVRLRQRDRQLEPRDRVGQRQDAGRSSRDQEHRHREGTESASGEDPLLGSCGRRDQSRNHRLEEEARASSTAE